MKVCPKCKMTVDANTACPICHTTITYEPDCDSDREKYILNRYFLWYMLKQTWFSLLCLLIVAVRQFTVQAEFNESRLISVFFVVISLVCSIFQRKIAKYMQWKYSKEHSTFEVDRMRITTGLFGVLTAFFIR